MSVKVLTARAVSYTHLNKVGFNAVLLQQLEHKVGHAVVYHAFAHNRALFLAIERRCVVLIINNAEVRIVRCKDLFGFSLINLLTLFHDQNPPSSIQFKKSGNRHCRG